MQSKKEMLAVLICFFATAEYIVAFQRSSGFASSPGLTPPSSATLPEPSNLFRKHLEKMRSRLKNREVAQYMDDELKRMEIKYYNLADADSTNGVSGMPYKGPVARPDSKCYEIVINAYAHAKIGKDAAHLAEDVLRRYESLHQAGEYADRYVLNGVLKAAVAAQDFQRAMDLMHLVEDRFEETRDMEYAPDSRMYNTLTSGLATMEAKDNEFSVQASREILNKMRSRFISGENPISMPNRYTYTHVMQCEARIEQGLEAYQRVEDLYRQLDVDYRGMNQNPILKPDALSALPLFQVALNSKGNRAVLVKAFDMFDELQARYIETKDPDFLPAEKMYKYLFASVARLSRNNAPEFSKRVDKVVEHMKQYCPEARVSTVTTAMSAKLADRSEKSFLEAEEMLRTFMTPDAIAYQTLIKAYARAGNAERAFVFWEEMERVCPEKNSEASTLRVLIDALGESKGRKKENLDAAEAILEKLIARYREEGNVADLGSKGSYVFEAVIRQYSKMRRPDAAIRIEELIQLMDTLRETQPEHFRPTEAIYLLALDAWAVSGDANAGKHAMAILRKVPKPSIRFLASTLASVCRSSGRGMVKTAESLYEKILEYYSEGDRSASVNARTLTTLLSAILRAPEADSGARAVRMLRKTIDLGKHNLQDLAPNTIVFNCVLNGLARKRATDNAWSVFNEMKKLQHQGYNSAPDAISYACVTRAVAGDFDSSIAIERLDELAAEVLKKIETGELEPDTQLFNTFIRSYASISKNEERAAEKANSILCQLELWSLGDSNASPDLLSYKHTIEAWAMSKATNSAELSKEVFCKAQNQAAKGTIGPIDCDTVAYMVLGHTRGTGPGALQQAEDFVDLVEDSSPELVNIRSYNTLLAAHANSEGTQKLSNVVRILQKLSKKSEQSRHFCQPDTSTYNWMILAAANSGSVDPTKAREAFDVALHNFKLLHTNDIRSEPDSLTYEFFLRTCCRLLPNGETRSKLVGKAFSLSARRGLVTPAICREAAKSDLQLILQRLDTDTESEDDHSGIIPDDWCEKIPQRKRRKQVHFQKDSSTFEDYHNKY